MGFFTKRSTAPAPSRGVPPLGSGRRLSSERTEGASLDVLTDILSSYRTPKYRELPHYDIPGWKWNGGETDRFERAVCCDDSNDDFLFIGFRSTGAGTEIGVFPLGSGDDRLTIPIIGHWKQRDPSLKSIGLYPAGLVTLKAPPVTDELFESTLVAREYPATPANVDIIAAQFHMMFLVKAGQYIGSKGSQSAVDGFIDAHPWQSGAGSTQRVLDDLVAWNAEVTPYIQGLPMRVRAMLLEAPETGTIWAKLHT